MEFISVSQMLIIQHERSMLNLDNKKPLLYWFCLLFDHSQVDIDYHQFILARWVLLLTVLPWCYCPEDRSHWWLASAGPQIQCCTWCVQASQLQKKMFWPQKFFRSHGQFGKARRKYRGPANNSKKGVKPMEKVNNNNNIDFSSATFTFHEMAPVQITFVSLVTWIS